jgi:hypothetical protein
MDRKTAPGMERQRGMLFNFSDRRSIKEEGRKMANLSLGYDQGMVNKLEDLLRQSRERKNSSTEQEAQRRSFAYGNTHFENERITRETVDRAAEDLQRDAQNRHTA